MSRERLSQSEANLMARMIRREAVGIDAMVSGQSLCVRHQSDPSREEKSHEYRLEFPSRADVPSSAERHVQPKRAANRRAWLARVHPR